MSSPLVANPVDAATLADELARFRIIDPSRLAELLAAFSGSGAVDLTSFLVQRGALNPFQAERALAGGARWLNLGGYHLIGEANNGTFGPVYIAVRRDRPGQFRLRSFPLRSLWRARQAKQIAGTLSSPPHPAVVPLVDADSASGLHYLVWPHVEGLPLAERVGPDKPLPVSEVVPLLVHLSNALHACHLLRVAHGTITPQAVILRPGDMPQLLEQGAGAILAENLAAGESLLDTLSATVALENVLEFAAPEFIARPGAPTPAADQYALGGVAYFALTGYPPYPAASRTEQLAAKLAGSPCPIAAVNPKVPPALAATIDQMLRPDPLQRFSSLAEVRNRLAILDGWPEAALNSTAVADTRLQPPRPSQSRGTWPPVTPGEEALPRDAETPGQSACLTERAPPKSVQTPRPFSPPRPASPRTEDPAMAKTASPDAPDPGVLPRPKSDPRKTAASPIQYHTETPPFPSSGIQPGLPEPADPGEPPLTDSVLWKKLKRNILFWRATREVVQVSVFGPPNITSGQPAKVSVYLHTPENSDSVHTLCRAFHHDAVLVGSAYLAREVAREEELGVHFSIVNAGVSKSMQTFTWRGQPHRVVFDLHVPWESPGGPAPGVVSIGADNARIAKVEFRLLLLPRKS
jgi:serine/threonine protein kinase